MEPKRKKILSFEELKIGFFKNGLKRVLTPPLNASAFSGELIAIIGHNGVGKSTLLRTLTGLQSPLGGEIFVNDKNLKEFDRIEIARNIAYISTETIKTGNMTVFDLVSLGRHPHTNWFGRLDENDLSIILDSIKKTGMVDFSTKNIGELSDGELQRAMIARTLAQDTGLLIMDEPTAFLDIKNKFEIVHLMQMLTRKRGKTVIFSTHDLQTALNEADKIWMILDGGLIEGAPEDLIINESLDLLFNDPVMKFNRDDATFKIPKETIGMVNLKGEGAEYIWTSKALNRMGYEISESKADMSIIITTKDGKCEWQLHRNREIKNFRTVYDLIFEIQSLQN